MNLSLLFTAHQVWASSSAGAEGYSAPITQLIYPLINFLIFLYILKRFLLPMITDHLRSRREGIMTAVKTADEAKAQVEAELRDYRDRLSHMDEEIKRIRETLRAEGEREKANLLREAEELASKIKVDTDFLAQQEVKVARQQTREEIARTARAAAEKIIKSEFKAADQQRLLEQFLLGIGEAR